MSRGTWAALLGLALSIAGACRKAPEPGVDSMAPKSNWDVYKGERKVLWIKNEPGPLMSTALLPPGAKPAAHPFLTATALDANEEDALRGLLEAATDFDEFASLLKKNGYTLKPSAS